ncbi:MAG: anthranilate phosphoribosyltransferase [Pseudomonadota bacterium]
MNIQQAIASVVSKQDLSADDMTAVMRQIMTGEATPAQIGGFLIGLRMKGETVDEIAAAAGVMRELATPVNLDTTHLVDVVGTGGDSSGTFNVSTASAIVAAAAGARVAKHGNRSASSKSGAADLLEAAGVNLDISPEKIAECVNRVGVGFMFAVKHHGAMKHAIGPRKEMAARTIFNVLGPLTNPAGAPNQVLGVYARELVEPIAQVLNKLGSRHVMVVQADDGMDEISVCSDTQVAELKDGKVSTYKISPADFGMDVAAVDSIRVDGPEASLAVIHGVLDNEPGPARDIVCLNAGATVYVAGLAESHTEGVAKVRGVIESGAARATLDKLASLSNS